MKKHFQRRLSLLAALFFLSITAAQSQLNSSDRELVASTGQQIALVDEANPGFFDVVQPLNWINIIANRREDCITVEWITSTQINVKSFRVEYSRNGKNWKKADEETRAYTLPGISHYLQSCKGRWQKKQFIRVRVEDFDGSYSYSPVATVQLQ